MKTGRNWSMAAVFLFLAVPLGTPAQEKKDSDQKAPLPPRTEQEVRIALMRRVKEFPGIKADKKTTIQDALDFLSREFSLRFRVDEEAFKGTIGVLIPLGEEGSREPTYSTIPISSIPAISNRSLYSILRMVLNSTWRWVPATFAIRDNVILITTEEALKKRGLCPEPPPNAARSTRAHELYQALNKQVQFPGIEKDERLTFRATLNLLEKQYGLTLEINDWAFQAEVPPVKEVQSELVVQYAGLPRADRTTPALVLHVLLGRVPTTSGTAFVIQHDCVEITTMQNLAAERWPGRIWRGLDPPAPPLLP